MQIFLFIALILMGVTIIFAVQNTATATVRFLAWELEGSLALVLLVAAAAGALISFFFSLPTLIRDKWTVRSLRKKVNELEPSLDEQADKLKEAEKELTDQAEVNRSAEEPIETVIPESEQEEASPIPEQQDKESKIDEDSM